MRVDGTKYVPAQPDGKKSEVYVCIFIDVNLDFYHLVLIVYDVRFCRPVCRTFLQISSIPYVSYHRAQFGVRGYIMDRTVCRI